MPSKIKAITKDILIGELVKQYPQSVGIMLEHGLQCIGCHVASWETLEQGATSHGIDVKTLLKEINDMLKVKK